MGVRESMQPGGLFVNKRNIVFALCVLCVGFPSRPAIAQSQSCTVQKDYQRGDPLAPGGVVVSDGVPDFEVIGYTQCPTHVCETCNKAKAGNPIDLATGNTYITQNDIRLPGLGGGLTLSRTWNSISRSDLPSAGMFGSSWGSTYEEYLYIGDDHTIAYARGDGSVWSFVLGASGTFSPAPPPNTLFTYRLVAPASVTAAFFYSYNNWTLILQNGEHRIFDSVSGKLLSIIDRNGNTTQLAYDASYRLTTVTDAAGRHLYFTYGQRQAGLQGVYYLVAGVTSDAGVSLSYNYDNLGRLSQVTEPDQTTISFQYNAPSSPFLISAVLDSSGKVLESHTYFQCSGLLSPAYGWLGRGITSAKANGVEAVSVSYNSTGGSCQGLLP